MRSHVRDILSSAAQMAAIACLILSIVSLFVLTGSILDSVGYHYDVEGGSALEKIHPATLMVIVALGLRVLAEGDPLQGVRRVFLSDPYLLAAISGFVALEICIVAVLKQPATPPFDSYFLPVFLCFALKGLNARWTRIIAIILVAIFIANAGFALYERATGTRLFFIIPDDITGHPEDATQKFDWKGHLLWDWRSSAMFGHPLENAMITGCFILILQARASAWIPTLLRVAIILLQAAAMVTFGGRIASVLVVAISALWWLHRGIRAVAAGKRIAPRRLAAVCLAGPVFCSAAVLALDAGALDKNIERFSQDDGSAETRLTMWRLFNPIPLGDILFGPDKDVVDTHQRLEGLELGIESFWAGMPLAYGVILSVVVIASWIFLCLFLAGRTRPESWVVIVFYFLVGSASAGLASKTTSLGLLVILVLVLMSRHLAPQTEHRERAEQLPDFAPAAGRAL